MKIIRLFLLKMLCVVAVMNMQLNAQKQALSETNSNEVLLGVILNEQSIDENEKKYALEYLDILNDEIKVLSTCVKEKKNIGKTLMAWNMEHEDRILKNRNNLSVAAKQDAIKVSCEFIKKTASCDPKEFTKRMTLLCEKKQISSYDMGRYIFTKCIILISIIKAYSSLYNLEVKDMPTEIMMFIEEFGDVLFHDVSMIGEGSTLPFIEDFYTCKEMVELFNAVKKSLQVFYDNLKEKFAEREDFFLKSGEVIKYGMKYEDEMFNLGVFVNLLFSKSDAEKNRSILKRLFCCWFWKAEKKEKSLSEISNNALVNLFCSATCARADTIKKDFVVPTTTEGLLEELKKDIKDYEAALEFQIKKAYKIDTLPSTY
jgi:hypothetical protein